jgi:hypothetical protein
MADVALTIDGQPVSIDFSEASRRENDAAGQKVTITATMLVPDGKISRIDGSHSASGTRGVAATLDERTPFSASL